MYVSHSANMVSKNAQAYIAMSNPFVFVSILFIAFRTIIRNQDKRIKELEDKLKEKGI
jgi:preprotein translocase subunit YajC